MRPAFTSVFAFFCATAVLGQNSSPAKDLQWLTDTAAVSGYESHLSLAIEKRLSALHPQRDNMGNIIVTLGSGAPHRLLVAPMDEPGYVVSHIEDDGYLRVTRLPQTGLPPHYNEMQNAQPMVVETLDGKQRSAVVAGLSIHLTPGRASVPDPDDIDNMYIDLGARTKADVLASGVDILSPISPERSLAVVGNRFFSGTAVGDRFGAAVLLQIAEALAKTPARGTTTIAFVAQQWTGSRGLIRVLEQTHPDELIYIGRANKPLHSDEAHPESQSLPKAGSGAVWSPASSATKMDWLGSSSLQKSQAAPFVLRGYGPAPKLPERTIHLSVPTTYPLTAGEMIDAHDLDSLTGILSKHLGISVPSFTPEKSVASFYPNVARPTAIPSNEALLRSLTLAYGVSEAETMSREAVAKMLPSWAHPTTDSVGNLILHVGSNTGPNTVFMAHTDELGFRIRSIDANGTIELDNKGGGTTSFFWGHPAVVHTSAGMLPAVVGLPPEFDTVQFHFPKDFRSPATLNVGANSAAEVEQLRIKVGDSVTIPKRFRTLLNRRVSIRSLDDRVGCAALVHAVWEMGEKFPRNVTFVWSTQEELGLLGAVAYAEASHKTNTTPSTIFAIDTFVSSDSPLESKRYADGILGDGFLVRAIDNSNIVPWKDVQQVRSIARSHQIRVQYGVTGGGNDGAAFQRYGTTDVALSWPLRNSHSPGEVMDLGDLDSLSSIVVALAKEWKQ
jgi:putative aminopeptidase FrvX